MMKKQRMKNRPGKFRKHIKINRTVGYNGREQTSAWIYIANAAIASI
jgi:hypothetical protein